MELNVNSLKIFIDKVKEQQEQTKNIGLSELSIAEIKHIYIAIPDEEFNKLANSVGERVKSYNNYNQFKHNGCTWCNKVKKQYDEKITPEMLDKLENIAYELNNLWLSFDDMSTFIRVYKNGIDFMIRCLPYNEDLIKTTYEKVFNQKFDNDGHIEFTEDNIDWWITVLV